MIYDSDYYVGSDLGGDSLSHHGVPRQKWGVRNGPPYPIQRGRETHYNVGKMTEKTKEGLKKAGKITSNGAKAVGSSIKSAGSKVKSSFQKWKENTNAELAIKQTDNVLLKNWQKKQLRISDMTNQELQQRIDRKKLEETYKHALRGDFSDPKTWNKASKDAKSGDGKKAADSILGKLGSAAVDGIAQGLTAKISDSMTAKSKAKIARREARRNAIAEVVTDAMKERREFKEDYKTKQKNEAWKERQDQKEKDRRDRRARRESYGDGAMDATYSSRSSYGSGRRYNQPGLYSVNSYRADPDEYNVR